MDDGYREPPPRTPGTERTAREVAYDWDGAGDPMLVLLSLTDGEVARLWEAAENKPDAEGYHPSALTREYAIDIIRVLLGGPLV